MREGITDEEARSKIWMYDVHGLIVDVSVDTIITNNECFCLSVSIKRYSHPSFFRTFSDTS